VECLSPEVFALGQGDQVRIFLLGKGVECEQLDTDQFMVTEQMKALVNAGGEMLACGTCLKIRQEKTSEMCPISTMKDLYEVITESDRMLTF
jgi:predicted peroxiredoxin